FGPEFQLGNFAAAAWIEPLAQAIERARPGNGQRLAAALMSGAGGVVSAEHGYQLFELAAVLARDGAAAFERALRRFLDDFGHRGVYEAELANPRWIEEPAYIV